MLLLSACNAAKSTDRLLSDVWANDQNIRYQMLRLTKAVTAEGRVDLIDSLLILNDALERVDAENMATVDSVLRDGLPKGLSHDSYKTIWIVIDHASLDKQEHYLPLIEQMSNDGLIGKDEYATLFDRIAMKNNRPQRYGSQTVQFGSADSLSLYLWPLESPTQVDSLRAAVGMSPIAEYLDAVAASVGMDVQYDPKLSVEALNQMRNNE